MSFPFLVLFRDSFLPRLENGLEPRREKRVLERLPFVNKNRKFRLETQMVQLIPSESFWKRWKSSEVFLFSRSNRNDRKNPVPFVNSHSTRCTSASFPAIRRCRCSRHFDLLLFSLAARVSGLAKRHTGKILYHYEHSIPTGFSVQLVNAPVLLAGACSE